MNNLLWKSDLENGKYTNPILFADYSDPDVIRVGDTYYMTASSFNYIPGLPILISKDLVNWKLVNYALEEIPYPEYNTPQHAKGVWAPAIRFHEGMFYIYYGMPDEGIFMVRTKNPLEKWEKPVCVLAGKGLIDSCPFWDEDGRAYVIHGYANSRIGFKSHLGIFEMSADGTKAISEDHIIFNGLETQPTIEGPKVYKLNGIYYILAPAGGVKKGWQTALRASNIHGPYEEMIVCAQGETEINGPHQGALVDTPNGKEWWFVHFQDRGLYGRICHLQPVAWKDGWPVIGKAVTEGNASEDADKKGYCGEPVYEWNKPDIPASNECTYLEASDDFKSDNLNLMWQWMGNCNVDAYNLDASKGSIHLTALQNEIIWNSSNVLTQKIVCPYFVATVDINFADLMPGEKAGMLMMGGEYAYLAAVNDGGKYKIVFGMSETIPNNPDTGFSPAWLVSSKKEVETVIVDTGESIDTKQVKFEISLTKENGFGMAIINGDSRQEVGEASKFKPSDHTWVGAKLGIFGNAQFMNFSVLNN